MRILAVISIPIVMFCDYYLTLLGKKLREGEYSQHFVSEQYELNPVWQKDINKFKKFNYKHLLSVILVTGYYYFVALLLNDAWFFALYGMLFMIYIYIIMRHLNNILIFSFTKKNPGLVSGKVTLSHIFSLKISQYQIFTTAIFLILIYIWTWSWFILGGIGGMLLFFLTQIRWINRYKRKKAAINQPKA